MTDWPSLVRQHGPLVWRIAYRILGHDADTRDCFQQCFLQAMEWDERSRIRNWPGALRRIATVRALDFLRSRYRWQRTLPLPDGVPEQEFANPLDCAAQSELSERLRQALTEIDPQQANVFSLVCLDGMTNGEAAESLGISANHVGVLLHRARQALQQKLEVFDPARTVGEHREHE